MTYVYKYTFSVEMAPICHGDLVCLPKHFHKSMGGIGPFVLCEKVFSSLMFIDPITLQKGEIQGTLYWRHPFTSMMNSRQLQEYYVIDVELTGEKMGKYALADVEICKGEDIGGDSNIMVKTHLGNLLNPGDSVMGYDVTNANFNDVSSYSYKESELPKVVLVKKFYDKKRNRKFKLKSLDKKSDENKTKTDLTKMDKEYEEFLEELEEDQEMRSRIKLYKDNDSKDVKKGEDDEDDEEGAPGVSDDELIDEEGEIEEEPISEQDIDEDLDEEEYKDVIVKE
jgi:nonsense-mediated mRNA decay protein 3